MATSKRAPVLWRSASSVPVRPVNAVADETNTISERIPQFGARPTTTRPPFTPKAFSGEVVPFTVRSFREGHDRIGVQLRLHSPDDETSLHRLREAPGEPDLWRTEVALVQTGLWWFVFESFADDFATWQHNAQVKISAGVDAALMREAGAGLFDRAAQERSRPLAQRRMLTSAAEKLRDSTVLDELALQIVSDPKITASFDQRPLMSLVSVGDPIEITVERERAGVGAWYEFFPRSEGAHREPDGSITSGTFATATRRLPAVAEMGFEVLYLPPIHPIGVTNRKGPNNSLQASETDPGSPWAIGAAAGGHDAVHPDLGTVDDFRQFVRAASDHGIEIALDLALQTSPDHPWVREHPEWFTTLPDGSIAYAENPPKKYQDIYPINFDNDPNGIRVEVLRIVRHWIAQGVSIFRVDNPHTKPLQFWEWLIGQVRSEHPDVVFLAEAFTRPTPLQALAMAGFQQSYTYFTWRNSKAELEEFLSSLAEETADFLRPNLFVNTPDILTEYLQFGGRPAYKIRAAIAATAAPSYGVYAGYELCENIARPGSEENIDNEKYECKIRDWEDPDSLAPYLRRLNEIRAAHPALRQLRNTRIHWSDDDAILVYSKHLPAELSAENIADTVLVVANVDPHSTRQTIVHLDTQVFGVGPGDTYVVEDLITGQQWEWSDHNFVRLDAFDEPVHILHVRSTS